MEKKNDFSFYLDNEENYFNNRDLLKDLISKLDYQYPSFIQEKILISKNIKDLNDPVSCSIIKSEAGTGKTLAYLIPLIQKGSVLLWVEVRAGEEGCVTALH